MNFYEILKTKKLGRGSPDYWTQLFAEHVGGKGEWKIAELTGTLPITFRSNGTALINYRIYGTADGAGVQTENLVESVEQGTWSVTGFVKSDATTRCRVGNVIDIVGGQQYTIYLECPSHNGLLNIQFKNDAGISKGETGWQNVGASGSYTATVPSDATKATVILAIDSGSGECSPTNFQNIMLVKSSTPPESYIPHGYKLPLTTSGTESKDTDIYIGDSKLLSGDYVDYESGKIIRNGAPQDPPLPLPAIETFKGENTLDSTETLGEVTIKGQIKPQS